MQFSQQAISLAYGLVASGVVDSAVGCGVESMTRNPGFFLQEGATLLTLDIRNITSTRLNFKELSFLKKWNISRRVRRVRSEKSGQCCSRLG